MEEVTEETTLETLLFYAKKIVQYKHHFIFLTACREMNVIPHGLRIKKTACIQTVSEDFDTHWDSILHQSEIQLLLHLQEECCVIVRKWHSGFYDVLLQSDVDEMELLNLMSTLSESISKEETDLFIRRIHKTFLPGGLFQQMCFLSSTLEFHHHFLRTMLAFHTLFCIGPICFDG